MKNKALSAGITAMIATFLTTNVLRAQERVDIKWEPRTLEGQLTRDLIAHQKNKIIAYVTKVNGITNTIFIGWDNLFIPRFSFQIFTYNPPYGTNDFFFDHSRNQQYRMGYEGFDERGVNRSVKSYFDDESHDISLGPVNGEGIG
ncbi:MAG: hypothetical protein AABW65_03560, partial [Nanoarchaeota archaeon]